MADGWFFVKESEDFLCAVRVSAVRRFLKPEDEGYTESLVQLRTVGEEFGAGADKVPPPVIVELANGVCWGVQEVKLNDSESELTYLAIAPELFEASAPWCRGVLWSGERDGYFVLDPDGFGWQA